MAPGNGTWNTSFLAPATDGDLRVVNLHGTEGDPTLTAESHDTVATRWRPYVMPSGSGFKLYTIKQDGDILMREVGTGSDGTTELGAYETLPVTAADTRAAGSSGSVWRTARSATSSTRPTARPARCVRSSSTRKTLLRRRVTRWPEPGSRRSPTSRRAPAAESPSRWSAWTARPATHAGSSTRPRCRTAAPH
ncbi:hypothetical protein NKH18_19050 [Streptomyces sp. M10(2022)]